MQLSQTDVDKSALRTFFREKRRRLTEAYGTASAEMLRKNTEDFVLQCKDVRTVLTFFPVKGEPDILPLADALLRKGYGIAFPISHTETLTLEFKYVKDISELTAGAYGIPEPPPSAPTVTEYSDALCLVPALAFDRRGMRIGYGKGYYDRFLSHFCGKSLGTAFSEFVTEELPVAANDISVDIIITEKGVLIPNEIKK